MSRSTPRLNPGSTDPRTRHRRARCPRAWSTAATSARCRAPSASECTPAMATSRRRRRRRPPGGSRRRRPPDCDHADPRGEEADRRGTPHRHMSEVTAPTPRPAATATRSRACRSRRTARCLGLAVRRRRGSSRGLEVPARCELIPRGIKPSRERLAKRGDAAGTEIDDVGLRSRSRHCAQRHEHPETDESTSDYAHYLPLYTHVVGRTWRRPRSGQDTHAECNRPAFSTIVRVTAGEGLRSHLARARPHDCHFPAPTSRRGACVTG